jgi:ElaB/YqjD/DUF883 family membrane-anchored ribosome-binding protein
MSENKDYRLESTRGEETRLGNDITREAMESSDPDVQVQEVRASIERTRADMSETIEELQERLNPTHLKEQLKEQVAEQYEHAKERVRDATIGKVENMVERASDAVYETRRSIVDTISANPVPSALVGIGLAWLLMNGRSDSARARHRSAQRARGEWDYSDDVQRRYYAGAAGSGHGYGYGSGRRGESWDGQASGALRGAARSAGDAVHGGAAQVREAGSHLADRARETASGVVHQAQHAVEYVSEQAHHQAQRVEERFDSAMRESPLAVGAIALAVGTALGLAVPQTRRENQLMGDTRDALMDKAQTVAHDAMEQVQEVAEQMKESADEGTSKGSSQRQQTIR